MCNFFKALIPQYDWHCCTVCNVFSWLVVSRCRKNPAISVETIRSHMLEPTNYLISHREGILCSQFFLLSSDLTKFHPQSHIFSSFLALKTFQNMKSTENPSQTVICWELTRGGSCCNY